MYQVSFCKNHLSVQECCRRNHPKVQWYWVSWWRTEWECSWELAGAVLPLNENLGVVCSSSTRHVSFPGTRQVVIPAMCSLIGGGGKLSEGSIIKPQKLKYTHFCPLSTGQSKSYGHVQHQWGRQVCFCPGGEQEKQLIAKYV